MIADPRKEYLSNIDIDKSKVILNPPIILLFGGKMNETDGTSSSVRHRIYNNILINNSELFEKIKIIEFFDDWLHDSIYSNLLNFEEDLACAASLIVIVLECHGASAELGAFCVNEKIKEKVMIIMETQHYSENSFINLGPLRLLENDNVLSYNYDTKKCGNDLKSLTLNQIRENIQDYLARFDNTRKFRKDNNADVAFLIFELIRTFNILTVSEINNYLTELSIDIPLNKVKQHLFLLEKLELVNFKRIGSANFYYTSIVDSRVKFNISQTKIKISTMAYYEKTEKHRLEVYG